MRTRLRSKVTLLFIVCAALLAVGGTAMALVADPSGNTAPAPTIQSDKADYAPGELVTLTGSGWKAGESVNIKVNDTYGASWARNVDVTADASGNVTDSFNLPDWFVSDYDVTATGAQSGTATTTFTDSNPQTLTVADPPSTTQSVAQGSTATYGNVTVAFGGNSDSCTVTLDDFAAPAVTSGPPAGQRPADTGLPTDANAVFTPSSLTGVGGDSKSTTSFTVSTTSSTPVGTYTFHVKGTRGATGCQGGSDPISQTLTLAVTAGNSAPNVGNISGDATADEGQTKSYSVSATDPDSDTLSYAWSITSGSSFAHIDGASNTSSASLKFDDGPGTVGLQVVVDDGKGHQVTKNLSINVTNVAPNVTLSGPATADEGTTKHYTYTVTDPGVDTFTVSATYPNCGTGGNLVTGSAATTTTGGSFDCAFPDGPATTNVAIKVADSDGASTTASESVQIVAVANVNPTVTAPANQSSNEGASASFNLGSFTDPGPDSPWAVDVDWGDGSTHGTATKTATGSLGTMSHTYADGPATKTVTVKVTDKNGGSDTKTFTVTVNNVAPNVTLDPNNDLNVTEGSTEHTYNYTISDPGQDTQSVVTSCGTNGTKVTGSDTNTDTAGSFKCTFPDGPATSTVSAKATDSDGGSDTASESVQIVAVANVAPVVTAATNQSSNEGASASFNLGSFTDPGSDSPWAVDVDWGDGSTHGTATKTATGSLGTMSHTYADNGTKTVTVKVTDKNGGSDFKTFTVNVANVNPTITGIAVSPLQALIGQPVSFTGTATDPSSVDTTQGFSWQWSKDGGAYAPGANPFSTSFSTCGSHSVSAKATDKDQGTSDPFSASTSVQVYSGNWLPPLQVGKDNMVQKGQVVPVKISVAGCDGLNKTGLNPEIRLAKGDPTVGINEADFTVPGIVASADTSGVMRPVSDGYIYNLRIPSDASVKANDIYAIRVSPFGIEGQYMVIAVQIRK